MKQRMLMSLIVISTVAFSIGVSAATLRFANSGDVASMDPYAYYTTFNAGFLQNIYEPLVRYNGNLKLEPCLATSWKRTSPTVWRFKLRKGVKFQNGNSFTADDVVASLKRASAKGSPYQVATSMIKDVREVNEYTVDVILKGPSPVLLNNLAGVYIMDKQWMKQHHTLRPVNPSRGEESYATTHANGTGPFKLVLRRPGATTVLAINKNWWDNADKDMPTKVIFTPIKSDTTRVAALLSGKVDLIMDVPLQALNRLKAGSNVKVLAGKDLRVMLFGLNQGGNKLNSSSISDRNPLADVRVRKALYQAIDVDLINKKIMHGMAIPTGEFVAPQIQGYDPALRGRSAPYDPVAAKALLAKAGYPNGFDVGLSCPNDRYINPDQVCQAVAAMWARIGVRVHYASLTKTIFYSRMLSGKDDIYFFGWASTPQLDAYALLNSVFHSKSATSGQWNPGGYSNPQVDALVGKIAVEMDKAKRQRMISEAFRLIRDDYAALPLYQQPLVWAMSKNVTAVQAPDNKIRLWLVKIQ